MALHEGDIGAIIQATITTDGAVVDISDATVKRLKIRAPNGVTTAHDASWTSDGTDAKVRWTTTQSTDLAYGNHHVMAYLERPTWSGHTDLGHFFVKAYLKLMPDSAAKCFMSLTREPFSFTAHDPAVVIAGTGRTGTTFLMHLLKGFGLSKFDCEVPESGDALFKPPVWNTYAPVIKGPWLTEALPFHDEVAHAIKCLVIPLRDLGAVKESFHRRNATGPWPTYRENSTVEEFQDRLDLLRAWADCHGIPWVELDFPRHVQDAQYLHDTLSPWLDLPIFPIFERAHIALRTGPRIS